MRDMVADCGAPLPDAQRGTEGEALTEGEVIAGEPTWGGAAATNGGGMIASCVEMEGCMATPRGSLDAAMRDSRLMKAFLGKKSILITDLPPGLPPLAAADKNGSREGSQQRLMSVGFTGGTRLRISHGVFMHF